jgi:ABC-type antimicrobial peptide transport system permease subunit
VRRRREFALRAALGATGSKLYSTMIAETLRPAAFGALVGLAGAYALARGMNAFLFLAAPGDVAVYLVAAAGAMGVTALAASIAGRRLLSADPAESLRAD